MQRFAALIKAVLARTASGGKVLCIALTAAALLAGCATRPPVGDYPRIESHALPTDAATPLHDALAAGVAAHPGESGFMLLAHGADALRMRIALAQAAQRTLDLQYYLAEEDNTGRLLLEAALRAADRGVRVRLLVDGLNFDDARGLIATLNAHPRIEVRVFNPFGTADQSLPARLGDLVTHLDTLTRRMHDKAMIADNQVAVVGGRNLGDEYFDASPTLSFRDLDALCAGPAVASISSNFDTFWNSDQSYPLRALNRRHFGSADVARVRAALRAHWQAAAAIEPSPLAAAPLAEQIASQRLPLVWAPAEFWADSPRKVDAAERSGNGDGSAPASYVSPPAHRLGELARGAQREFLIASPYFVPHDAGVQMLGALVRRGVTVKVLTNSLASTDTVAVQAGYETYRVPLLRDGVELYEFRPLPDARHRRDALGTRSRASLHAKVYVIDRRILVIGSMNLDRRSVGLNTEMALVIHSPALAEQAARLYAHDISPRLSYQVALAPSADVPHAAGDPPASPLVWTDEENGWLVHYDFDPRAGLWRNLGAGLFLLLPVKNQL